MGKEELDLFGPLGGGGVGDSRTKSLKMESQEPRQ